MRWDLAAVALAAIVLFSTGDALAAAWGKTGKRWWFFGMLAAGNLAWVAFAYLNRTMPLAVVSGIVNVGLTVTSVLVGWLVFKESLRPLEKAGIVAGLVALGLFVVARLVGSDDPPT